ncbi:aminotransferase class-V [Yasminevirus sp. GU-2018]|uniref:NifS-like protein n=1 Tax=Yasminevirus sp. GU-2018 TaxID=2420051 RepID=A0A5K0U9E5_9VIRU|nr:aminotransferase class-V [Yasminevirus sp. GU-2018]
MSYKDANECLVGDQIEKNDHLRDTVKQTIEDTSNISSLKCLTYTPGVIFSPFTKKYNRIIFADDTASGRPCKLIDQLIVDNINPYYSNTHSNATCGTMMKDYVNKTRDIVRTELNVQKNQKVFFDGNGCTGAVNHLTNKIDLTRYRKIVVHTTPYEHHSNFLPWATMLQRHKELNPELNTSEHRVIDFDETVSLMLDTYIEHLNDEIVNRDDVCKSDKSLRLDIFALSACSNVTGRRYDLHYSNLWSYIKRMRSFQYNMYLILDYACSAPYVEMDLEMCDGCVFSGHKFLGGQSTPGVLIVNEDLVQTKIPYQQGGGCVVEADDTHTVYKDDKEMLEMCGTPNITGIIRFGYVLTLKRALMRDILQSEALIEKYATERFMELEQKYPTFKVLGLEHRSDTDLPIYPIAIKGMHYNLITVLLNDMFGVQTRGGLSCSGTLGRVFKEMYGVDGWCRVSLNYLLTKREIDIVIKGIEYIIVHRKQLKKLYSYDSNKNMYMYGTNL